MELERHALREDRERLARESRRQRDAGAAHPRGDLRRENAAHLAAALAHVLHGVRGALGLSGTASEWFVSHYLFQPRAA